MKAPRREPSTITHTVIGGRRYECPRTCTMTDLRRVKAHFARNEAAGRSAVV